VIERLFDALRQEWPCPSGGGLSSGSVPDPRALVGIIGMLDLDDVGAQHRQLIGRERPRQKHG